MKSWSSIYFKLCDKNETDSHEKYRGSSSLTLKGLESYLMSQTASGFMPLTSIWESFPPTSHSHGHRCLYVTPSNPTPPPRFQKVTLRRKQGNAAFLKIGNARSHIFGSTITANNKWHLLGAFHIPGIIPTLYTYDVT